MKPRLFTVFLLLVLPMLLMGALNTRTNAMMPDEVAIGTTTRVSVASDGTQGNSGSAWSAISADGRYVAFESGADNLVPGDALGQHNVFVHDRQTGQTSRLSVASDGTQGNGWSENPSISAAGRYVAFESWATNLVPGDTNGTADVFVHDRQTGQTSRVSVASDGTQGNSNSGDPSLKGPSISADGRYVAFTSWASNLVPGDTNGWYDIFVHDRQTGQTSRVSVASDGTQGNNGSEDPSISADGRYVAFRSAASNLVPGDTNGWADVFVHDRQTGQTSRISVASDGTQGNHWSQYPSISADGRYVAFHSRANNLVPGDANGYTYNVFVHDRQTGQISPVSVASDGTQGNGDSLAPSISADGRYMAFHSLASNLVPGDTNGVRDVFVHERDSPLPSLIANYPNGQPGSFFTLIGSDFPPNNAATVAINGVILTETLMIDSSGSITFLLDTSQADPGSYFVTLTANSTATTGFVLDPSAPLRPQEGSGTIFDVPGGIAFTKSVYLPVVRR